MVSLIEAPFKMKPILIIKHPVVTARIEVLSSVPGQPDSSREAKEGTDGLGL